MENRKMEIAEFYKKVFSDFKLKEKLEEKVKKITNEEDFKKLIREEIVPLMKKFKVNFSEEDLLNYEKETLKEISDEILENVNGGASIKAILLTGGLLSMVLLGGAGLSASAMDNEPPALPEQKRIIQTSSNEQQQNNSNTDNSQNNGNNADKGDVSKSSKSEEKASVTESHQEGGANVSDSEVRSTEEEPPKISVSEEDAPETNNDTEKAKLKKAFIKELLKHNVDLVSLYDKNADGSFNNDNIAEEINALLNNKGPKPKISIEGVNLDQTNCDATNKCIKLATEVGETDVTFDEIRIFNLEKIRRAYGRNIERHQTGRWDVFKGQRFAGILSYEHSLLDPNKGLASTSVLVYNNTSKKNEEKNGLVQKLIVKTPFGNSELWVYYYIDNGVLVENNRMIYNKSSGKFLSYNEFIQKFREFSEEDGENISKAILDYLSIKLTDENDMVALNEGKSPLDMFNEKQEQYFVENPIAVANGNQAMSDLTAVLVFCENSYTRIMAGGKWERALLNAVINNPGNINNLMPCYWLSVTTNSEVPSARVFSRAVVKNLDWSLEDMQNFADGVSNTKSTRFRFYPPLKAHEKMETLGNLEFSDSSNEENQDPDAAVAEHKVESIVKIGEIAYTLSQKVKCADGINPGELIERKYKYLKPTVSKIDGENISMQPTISSSASTTASDAEEADKK